MAEYMKCGHHISLERRSVESSNVYCAFCDTQSQLRDAVAMENHYRCKYEKEKELSDKYKWQIRDTCRRAEIAEEKLERAGDANA